MGRALNTEDECLEYLKSRFPGAAKTALPLLQKLTPLLGRDIGSDLYRIKGYTRGDGIGFGIFEREDQVLYDTVRTGFVVLNAGKKVMDFYRPGYRNNFAITKSFDEVRTLTDEQLQELLRSSFVKRAANKRIPVQW